MLNYKKEIFYPLLIASILISVVLACLFYVMYNLNDISNKKDLIDEQRFNIIALRNAILDAETSQRGYLLTNNVTFLEHYKSSQITTKETITRISNSFQQLPALSQILQKVTKLCDEKFKIIDASISVQLSAGAYASHLTLSKDRGKLVMEQIRAELSKAENKLLSQRQIITEQMQHTIWQTIISVILLVLIIFGILLFSYRRTLRLFMEIIANSRKVDHLNHEATHDPLTNLINRRGFKNTLDQIHSVAIREKRNYAIFYMDLDGFKAVNDQYSHEIGDQLLIAVAKLFQSHTRERDCLARLGGDEFMLIIPQYKDKLELKNLANRLISSLSKPIYLNNQAIKVGVSIGIAIYPFDAENTEQLIAAADSAMYESKKTGKNKVSFSAILPVVPFHNPVENAIPH